MFSCTQQFTLLPSRTLWIVICIIYSLSLGILWVMVPFSFWFSAVLTLMLSGIWWRTYHQYILMNCPTSIRMLKFSETDNFSVVTKNTPAGEAQAATLLGGSLVTSYFILLSIKLEHVKRRHYVMICPDSLPQALYVALLVRLRL